MSICHLHPKTNKIKYRTKYFIRIAQFMNTHSFSFLFPFVFVAIKNALNECHWTIFLCRLSVYFYSLVGAKHLSNRYVGVMRMRDYRCFYLATHNVVRFNLQWKLSVFFVFYFFFVRAHKLFACENIGKLAFTQDVNDKRYGKMRENQQQQQQQNCFGRMCAVNRLSNVNWQVRMAKYCIFRNFTINYTIKTHIHFLYTSPHQWV